MAEARKESIAKTDELAKSMRNAGLAIAAVSGTITAGLTLMGKDVLAAYSESADAVAKLTAAMTANGTLTDSTMASYQAFAVEMQKLTKTDDDAALGMLQYAESLEPIRGRGGTCGKERHRDAGRARG